MNYKEKTLQLRNDALNQDLEFTMPNDAKIIRPIRKGYGYIYELNEGIMPVDKFHIKQIRVGVDQTYPSGKVIFYNDRGSPVNYFDAKTTINKSIYHYQIKQ